MAKRTKEVQPLNEMIAELEKQVAVAPFVREYMFEPGRKWAFDIAWPDYMMAVEYEGNTWGISRHNTGAGYRADVDKYNSAAVDGWCVIRVTADMVRDFSYLTPIIVGLAMRKYAPAEGAQATAPIFAVTVPDPWEKAEIG